jgi:hypothetical protein
MDRFNFYFEQLVGEADMDEVFDFAENADHALMTDNGYTGIVSGLGVTENTVPDLNVIVAIGTAYDQTGQRIRIGAPQTLDMSVDSNSVSTTVAVNGNEKWLSIFAQFTRALSDPRIDGNGVTVQYREAESFTLIKEQGAEAAPGTAASLLAANSETYALTDGNTLTLQVNGGAVQTVTFNTGDFAAIGAATAAEVASVIDTQTTGVNASDSGGAVLIETLTANAIAKLQVTGGTDAAAFAFPGSIASGAGGPTPPALKGDALLLADVLIRRDGGGTTTTQIFNAPDAGGAAGYIEGSRREVTFIFNGTTFEIREGTITGFATQLAQDLQNHISNTGNAHPSTAITFDGTGSSGPDLPPLGATATVDSALDELDLRKASLGNDNAFTGGTNIFNGANFSATASTLLSLSGNTAALSGTGGPTTVQADAANLLLRTTTSGDVVVTSPDAVTVTGNAAADGVVLDAPTTNSAVRLGNGTNDDLRLEATTNANSAVVSETSQLHWSAANHPFTSGTDGPLVRTLSNGETFAIGAKAVSPATDRVAVIVSAPRDTSVGEVVMFSIDIVYWDEATQDTRYHKMAGSAVWDGGGVGGNWDITTTSYGWTEYTSLAGAATDQRALAGGSGSLADLAGGGGQYPVIVENAFALELRQEWASDTERIHALTTWTLTRADAVQ